MKIHDHGNFHKHKGNHEQGKAYFLPTMPVDGSGSIDQIDIKHRSQCRVRGKIYKTGNILKKGGNGIPCSDGGCKVVYDASQSVQHHIKHQKDKKTIMGTADMSLNVGVNQTTQADQKACNIKR